MIHHNPTICRLGKQAAQPSRLRLTDYTLTLPTPPEQVNNSGNQTIPLAGYLNDQYGDCTCAGIGNTLRVNSKGTLCLADQDILAAYIAVTGQEGAAFDPSTGANDNGCVEIDVLDYWAKVGVGGHKILGHAGVNMKDLTEAKAAAELFGSVYLGLALATEQQSQAVWDYVPGSTPGSWGGHCTPLFDCNVPFAGQQDAWVVGTWGAYKAVTPAFLTNQADEGHVVITPQWLASNGNNPLIDIEALTADLVALQHEN